MDHDRTIIALAGDVLVDRNRPAEVFERVQGALDDADLVFANLEGPYTDDPQAAPSAPVQVIPGASNLDVYAQCGFDVVSMANNHIVDAGHAAMLDTRDRLREQGVATCGAGASLDEAREPAILDAGGLRIAFLAYSSIFPSGYQARGDVPGLAPMRAHNLYLDPYPDYVAPGIAPIVKTVPNEGDLAHLEADIAAARQRADLVITSFHWGDFMQPFVLTDHETRTARWCIDQGADMVVGHHHHILRGMEWYQGKPIMYGLGHFVFDLKATFNEELMALVGGAGDDPDFYGIAPREGWPLLPLHADSRMTALAWASVSGGRIDGIGFLPCRLRPDGRVVPIDPASDDGRDIIDYVEKGCRTQGLNGTVVAEADVVLGGHPTVRLAAPE
jgi:poly-gamma-glutamate synthesis protein (capsule biosynthesis protein)